MRLEHISSLKAYFRIKKRKTRENGADEQNVSNAGDINMSPIRQGEPVEYRPISGLYSMHAPAMPSYPFSSSEPSATTVPEVLLPANSPSSASLPTTHRRLTYYNMQNHQHLAIGLSYEAKIRQHLPDHITINNEAAVAISCFATEFLELIADHCDGMQHWVRGHQLEEALQELLSPDIPTRPRSTIVTALCSMLLSRLTCHSSKSKQTNKPVLLYALLNTIAITRLRASCHFGINRIRGYSRNSRLSNCCRICGIVLNHTRPLDRTTRLVCELSRVMFDQITRYIICTCVELVTCSDRTHVSANEVLLVLSIDPQLGHAFSLMDLRQRLINLVYTDPTDQRPALIARCPLDNLYLHFSPMMSTSHICSPRAVHTHTPLWRSSVSSSRALIIPSINASDLRTFMNNPVAALVNSRDDIRDSRWSRVFHGLEPN